MCEDKHVWTTAKHINYKTKEVEILHSVEVSRQGGLRDAETYKSRSDRYITKKGYIRNEIQGKKYNRNRLIASTFTPQTEIERTVYTETDHYNRNKLDNQVSNLIWSTRKMNDANKLCKPRKKKDHCRTKPWVYNNRLTGKYLYFATKEECQASIDEYQKEAYRIACVEARIEVLVKDVRARNTDLNRNHK